MDSDEIILGYYDDNDEFDDSLYNESSNMITEDSTNEQTNTCLLSNDIIQEILRHADIVTLVGLCSCSKSIRRLCTDQVWRYKFNIYDLQNKIISFEDWIKLYRKHLFDVQLYNKADTYIKSHRDIYSRTIKLQNELKTNELNILIEKVGYSNDHKIGAFGRSIKRRCEYNITNCYYDDSKNEYRVWDYSLTPLQFREFIYQLFLNNYLDDKWVYLK